jgi:hypothetical protein
MLAVTALPEEGFMHHYSDVCGQVRELGMTL